MRVAVCNVWQWPRRILSRQKERAFIPVKKLVGSNQAFASACQFETITKIPRTPSWSLKELHQEFDPKDTVISEDKLRELAELCHLEINSEEFSSLLKDVESIIQCTKTIHAITTDENSDAIYAGNFRDTAHAPLREDVVTEGNCPEEILANAAETEGYYFKVPKVLQDER